MIDESKQEEASLYVLGELSPEAAGAFEAELEANQELQRYVWDTHEAFALLALTVRPMEPPPYRLPLERRATPVAVRRRARLGRFGAQNSCNANTQASPCYAGGSFARCTT